LSAIPPQEKSEQNRSGSTEYYGQQGQSETAMSKFIPTENANKDIQYAKSYEFGTGCVKKMVQIAQRNLFPVSQKICDFNLQTCFRKIKNGYPDCYNQRTPFLPSIFSKSVDE